MTGDLFGNVEPVQAGRQELAPGAILLRGQAHPLAEALVAEIGAIARIAPFRRMVTPGGFSMSVEMTSCGTAGWITDRKGYRYSPEDPVTGLPWPAMPALFRKLAQQAASEAGYPDFNPDSCLINRYGAGARMALHQDKDERDFERPIVSVSLGLPAGFQFGGAGRRDPVRKYMLQHGDIVVWGGASRLFFHGITPLKPGQHALTGPCRINLTFRAAL